MIIVYLIFAKNSGTYVFTFALQLIYKYKTSNVRKDDPKLNWFTN